MTITAVTWTIPNGPTFSFTIGQRRVTCVRAGTSNGVEYRAGQAWTSAKWVNAGERKAKEIVSAVMDRWGGLVEIMETDR